MNNQNSFGKYIEQFRKDLKYRHLLMQLITKNIKSKYRRSFLGILWTLLNPLLSMLVMAFIFSQVFDRPDFFPIYLLSGSLIFGFHREATSAALKSITSNAGLIDKTYVPKGMLPLSSVMSALVNLGFSLIALFLVILYYTIFDSFVLGPHILMMLVIMPALFCFCLGIGYFLAALDVFFRDIEYLYSVILTLWMYLTPIFYTIDRFSGTTKTIIQFNPMFHFVEYFRDIVMYQTIPSFLTHLICYGMGIGSLIIGYAVFSLLKNKFVLHL